VFTPMKQILKLNIMQYQAGVSIYSPSARQTVQIDPVALRKSQAVFKVTDGLTPTDKQISGDDLTVAVQTIGSSQQIGAGFNLSPMFSYLMKTRNLDLTPFEKTPQQMAYEQAMGQWQGMAQQIAELAKAATMKIEGVTMKDLQDMVQKLIPPQPQPQQFGYQPGAPAEQQGNQPAPASQPSSTT
jgi:hypothetical protein